MGLGNGERRGEGKIMSSVFDMLSLRYIKGIRMRMLRRRWSSGERGEWEVGILKSMA